MSTWKEDFRRLCHFALWVGVAIGLLALLHALTGCSGLSGLTFEERVAAISRTAQAAAVATGQHWAVPVIGGLTAAATAVYHVVYGVPGVKSIPGTRAHRKRAVKRAQREAIRATASSV